MNTIPTLLQLIGTYSEAELEENYNDIFKKRWALEQEERVWRLALKLAKSKGLSDELTSRIQKAYQQGMVLLGVNDDGTELWNWKPNNQ